MVSRTGTFSLGIIFLSLTSFGVSNQTFAQIDDGCGKVIRGNFTLTTDLDCIGNGLIIGESNTIVNLDGHSIIGSGDNSAKVGVIIPRSGNVTIKGPGTIEGFQAGILMTGAANTETSRITFEGNKIGIFIIGVVGTTIEQNVFNSNTIAVASHSSVGAQIHANVMTGNNLTGIMLVNTDRSQIDANSINGSKNGIFMDSQSTNNNVSNNDIDINNSNGLPLIINGNYGFSKI